MTVHDEFEKYNPDHKQLQLQCSQSALFLLQMKVNLMQIQDMHAELPAFLQLLKRHSPQTHLPEYGLVMCYPFRQESFIFHAQDQPLVSYDIHLLQSHLLPRSAQIYPSHEIVLNIETHQCLRLFVGQKFAVWRIYFNYQPEPVQQSAYLYQLDLHLQQGFQIWTKQQDHIQQILQQERRDFSAELHDSIAQVIGFLRLKSAQINQQCKKSEHYHPLVCQTEELAAYTHYAYQQVRELITASRLTYQELDFIAALKKIVAEFEHQSSIAFELDLRVTQLRVSAQQSVQLLYIIRESLSNIVRHAHATVASISVQQKQQQWHIAIADNGRGIQPKMQRTDSFGLDIMQERAEKIGAVLRILPNKPSGTCVYIDLDIAKLRSN
ncbi:MULTISPECIES: sensor histidine kinase [unclassified Acinetobacter]|uniref:sensor histidine kinase n=1 Tax=unclassified Acinetobacter TaxID=196816 RepID=UPI0029347B46|nr:MULTISPECIES: ATP-binding protein [unclassified Acinetobacter]WOE32460.1 ATP-binding protein [Acinetobacter sp. SAAs470]WOE37935.1 ATP-binding protein [Acinetobacter sp. SAAs474]